MMRDLETNSQGGEIGEILGVVCIILQQQKTQTNPYCPNFHPVAAKGEGKACTDLTKQTMRVPIDLHGLQRLPSLVSSL